MADPDAAARKRLRVLITGASGMIGTALAEALLARGDEVVGLSRDPGRAGAAGPRILWHRWEPALERPPEAAFEGVSAVVNLAGERIDQRWNEGSKRRIIESRVTATRNLVEAVAALESKPEVVISGSAIGYYGDRGETILDESSPPGDDFAAGVVAGWERAAAGLEGIGPRLVILRTGHYLDPSGGFLGRLMLPFKLGLGGPIAGGAQYMSWIHRADHIGILLWALDSPEVSGAVNATAPNPVTNKEFSRGLGAALHRPAILPVPGPALDLVFGRGLSATIQGGQRVYPRRALDLGYRYAHPELPEALADLIG